MYRAYISSKWRIPAVVFCFVVSSLFVILCFFMAISLLVRSGGVSNSQLMYQYQLAHISRTMNQTSYSMIKMRKRLKTTEYLSFSQSGDFFIVSPLSEDKYECKGYCTCSSFGTNKRGLSSDIARRSTNIVKGGALVFISALTIGVAIQMANDYFTEECVNSFLEECGMNAELVEGVVEDCRPEGKLVDDYVPPQYEEEMRQYRCEGFCVDVGRREKTEEYQYAQERFDCPKHRRVGDVYFIYSHVERTVRGLDDSIHRTYVNANMFAKELFRKEYLHSYCWEISTFNYRYAMSKNRGGKWVTVRLCSSSSSNGSFRNKMNIKCRLVG